MPTNCTKMLYSESSLIIESVSPLSLLAPSVMKIIKANGELNSKYPGGIEVQKEKLEAEGHTITKKGRKNIKYYVKDYEDVLFDLNKEH